MSHPLLTRQAPSSLLSEQPYVWNTRLKDQPHSPDSILSLILDRIRNASAHYAEPASRQVPDLAERFRAYADRWRHETAALSSITEMAMHPDYQRIIGLGPDVVPLLLRELQNEPDHWFWALKAVTGVDPVPSHQRGRLPEMAESWLMWGKEQGLLG